MHGRPGSLPFGRQTRLVERLPLGSTSRAANLLVDQHGADAPIRAAQRADDMLAAGDMKGRAVWRGILKAVNELMATKPPGRVH